MARKTIIQRRVQLSAAGSGGAEPFDVLGVTEASFSAYYNTASGAAWSTAVVTFEKSNDGWSWAAIGGGTTLTSDGITSDLDLSCAAYVRARVSTAQTDAGYALITMVGLVSTDSQ